MARVSVILFPGSNCDHDVLHLYSELLGAECSLIWHTENNLKNPDLVVLPGGFSYGDYLRTGAIAKLSPVMNEVKRFADKGGPVLGICNGFQILCEAGLLPGVLLPNSCLRFLSRFVHIKVESTQTVFSRGSKVGAVISCPIAHFEGNYFADSDCIKAIEDNQQVIWRYCSKNGEVDATNSEWNVNGSINSIAGITNTKRNVVGLMPHPERASESVVGYVGLKSGFEVFSSSLLGLSS